MADKDTASSTLEANREEAVAPVIAEIAAGLKARSLTKVTINGTDGYSNLALQLAAAVQDNAVDPTVIRELNISNVDLAGAGIAALEPAFRSATGLTSLALGSTAIGDAGTIRVASGLRSAVNLQVLGLRNNGIGDAGISAIASSMQHWPSFLALTISGNLIKTEGAAALGEAIGIHRTISFMSLRSNPLKDDGLRSLCAGMKQNKSLDMLALENCQFTAEGLREMAESGVTRLFLGKNAMGDDGAADIAAVFQGSALTLVGFDHCGLGSLSAAKLGEELKVNTTLTVLAIDNNAVLDEGAVALATGLRRNTVLRSINLSENSIGDAGAVAMGQALAHNSTLRELTLTRNHIGTVGCAAFIEHLQGRPNFIQLSLADNSIGEDECVRLREAFCQSTVLVDIVDAAFEDGNGSAVATTLAAAIKGALDNTVCSIAIREDGLTMEAWGELMQALTTNTSVKSFDFRHVSGLSHALQFVYILYDRLAGVLKRNKTLSSVILQRSHVSSEFIGINALSSTLNETVLEAMRVNNTIGPPPLKPIFEALRVNTTLSRLALNMSMITPEEVGLLAESIQQNPASALRTLEMMNNAKMGDKSAVALAMMLRTNRSIEEITLCASSIGDVGATALAAALETNQRVSVVRVRHNDIGSNGAIAIAKALSVNHQIKVLQISNNRIGDLGAIAIGNALKEVSALVELSLGSNNIGDLGCEAIVCALRTSASLRALILSGNNITATGSTALFSALSISKCNLDNLALVGNPIATIGVEFLNAQDIKSVSLNYANLIWPPTSISSRATPGDRSPIHVFLRSVAASSSLLVRSRLMLVGHGGAGKTTLKTALLMSSDCFALEKLRKSIIEVIRTKWTEADIQSWVDVDLAEKAGFFNNQCPAASGITGTRWLEYSRSDLIAVFGASETEAARRVVRKMAEVLCFLQPQRTLSTASSDKDSDSGWGWITGVIANALERSAPHFGDFVGLDNPQNEANVNDADSTTVQPLQYGALLNLPHVWTEGIELENWDTAGYTVWDLPGQMELYPSHRMFSASSTAVYVLVVNDGRGHDACVTMLSRWLFSLRSGFRHSGDEITVPVRIVLSHTDLLTQLERESLMREVIEMAEHSNDFDFGPTCFATLYNEEGGGDSSTGVDALRAELLRLRSVGVDRHPLPTAYQRACDDVVGMARTKELSRWPIVGVDRFPDYDQPLEDIVGCLEDLGFVRRIGDRLILEPVTWLSRLMAAFLHPFHGVATAIAASSRAQTVREHIACATITSAEASRIVNQRGRIVQAENEQEVLGMLSNFDVCFELSKDRFVFPMLLPPAITKVPWLDKTFQRQITRNPFAARRNVCLSHGDAVPPSLVAMLMESVLKIRDCQPVYLGRCTAIGYITDRKCFIGLHQSVDDSAIDLFAAGEEQHRLLGWMILNLAMLLTKHYPRLRMSQQLLWMASASTDSYSSIATEEVNHVLLGRCCTEPSDVSEVGDTQLEHAARDVPAWLWQALEATVVRSEVAECAAHHCEHDDSVAFSAWKRSALRQFLHRRSQPLCKWIDMHYQDQESELTRPLRGRWLLVDILDARMSQLEVTNETLDTAEIPSAHRQRSAIPAPHMCGITFKILKMVYDQAAALAGDEFASWTMRDLNRAIVKPLNSNLRSTWNFSCIGSLA